MPKWLVASPTPQRRSQSRTVRRQHPVPKVRSTDQPQGSGVKPCWPSSSVTVPRKLQKSHQREGRSTADKREPARS